MTTISTLRIEMGGRGGGGELEKRNVQGKENNGIRENKDRKTIETERRKRERE
jgi:hypothetical protein